MWSKINSCHTGPKLYAQIYGHPIVCYNWGCFDAIFKDCKDGLKEISLIQIHHCYRKANKCANVLVRRGALLPQDFVVFLETPADVALMLSLDTAGVASDRSIPSCNFV